MLHSSGVNPAAGTAGTGTAATVTGAGVGSCSSGGGSIVTSISSNLSRGQQPGGHQQQLSSEHRGQQLKTARPKANGYRPHTSAHIVGATSYQQNCHVVIPEKFDIEMNYMCLCFCVCISVCVCVRACTRAYCCTYAIIYDMCIHSYFTIFHFMHTSAYM